ncbi:MAG: signal peptide peptidase SppA [Pseudomonadota bacterium]
MSDRDSGFTVWGFIKGFGKLIIGLLLLLQGLIGLVVLLLIVGVLVSVANGVAGNADKPQVAVPTDAALLINPNGVLVEQAAEIDPFEVIVEEAYGINQPTQIEVHDLVRVIRKAKDDKRIKGIVLDLGALQIPSYSASKAHYLASEIGKFKESGKSIIAVGDFYSQEQYMLAAAADEIHMNDYGNIIFLGYGRYGTYIKSFLEKLKITSHVFRVGTFKSAVEPFLRDDMSEEAKEANRAFLDVLWREYMRTVEQARGLQVGAIENYANNFGDLLRANNGDPAKAALEAGLIDQLNTRAEQRERLVALFGKDKDGKSYKKINFRRYLASLDDKKDDSDPNIAVITASGAIVDGQAPLGEAAGGDTIAALLRKAREDENVKAVVLRIDSPGGSAFASDVIRDELLAIKAEGKPLVASMGSLAASGGYWIASPADEIWAAPTTVTGSIGIFGYFNTFENTAAEVGVFTDGVGTTSLSPLLATGIGPLPEEGADLIQQIIENGYDRFLTVVGEGRDLDKDYVDSVGQGRVWIGERAKDLKLVDNLGGIDESIEAAARLANLESWDVVEMTEKKTPFEKILGNLSAKVATSAGIDSAFDKRNGGAFAKAASDVKTRIEFFEEFNDPNAAYARCLACE